MTQGAYIPCTGMHPGSVLPSLALTVVYMIGCTMGTRGFFSLRQTAVSGKAAKACQDGEAGMVSRNFIFVALSLLAFVTSAFLTKGKKKLWQGRLVVAYDQFGI